MNKDTASVTIPTTVVAVIVGEAAKNPSIAAVNSAFEFALNGIFYNINNYFFIYKKKMTGSFGDMGCYSFYANKIITTGEGGGVFCKSSKLKKIIESIRDWGRDCWCDTGCDNTCKKRFKWKLETNF